MTSEQTVKCPICGKPYVTYMHYAGDQSACPSCRMEAMNGFKYVITTSGTGPQTNKIKGG